MTERVLVGGAIASVLLAAVAMYFLYSSSPPLPSAPTEVVTLPIDGHPRHYLVFVPSHMRAGASVLFAFHPSRSSGERMRRYVGSVLERIAERQNIVVVYPDGYEGHFNDCRRVAAYSARTLNIDDVGFAKRIIEHLAVEKNINPEHVYAIGYSNGGHMALRLARYGYVLENGRVVLDGDAKALAENEDIKEFYLGIAEGKRKSFRAGKHYKRRKRWLA